MQKLYSARLRDHARTLFAGFSLALLLVARPGVAPAAPAVDQDNSILPTGNFTTIRSGATASQTFTVGFAGTLTGVKIVMDPRGTPAANLNLEVQATTAGVANGTVLATGTLAPFGGSNPTVLFDVSAASLAVTPGQVLALVLKSNATLGDDYLVRIVPSDRYTRGQLTDSGGGIGSGAGWDAIFKTLVEPANTPGPGTSDQANHPAPTGNFAAIFSGSTATQTFTVGATGTLTGISVVVDPRNTPVVDLMLEVQATTGGAANGTILASAVLAPFGGTNPTVSFDLSPYNLSVTSGDVLAFILRSNAAAGTDYLFRTVPGNTYAGGQFTNSSGGFPSGSGWDAIFETFVAGSTTAVGEPNPAQGPSLELAQSRPNPMTRSTSISFSLPVAGPASVTIYDVSGRLVRTLVDGTLTSGSHEVIWNRDSDRGTAVPSGVYFYRLVGGGETRSLRILVAG